MQSAPWLSLMLWMWMCGGAVLAWLQLAMLVRLYHVAKLHKYQLLRQCFPFFLFFSSALQSVKVLRY
jgi:hypothetical protein